MDLTEFFCDPGRREDGNIDHNSEIQKNRMGASVYARIAHIEVRYLEKLYVPYLFEFSMMHSESKYERMASIFPTLK